METSEEMHLTFVTMVHAFNSKNINVQKNDDGKLTFKLEKILRQIILIHQTHTKQLLMLK